MKFSLRHQSTGKVYPYLASSAHLMLRAFLRKIYIYNRQGVPTDKPALLAANHPTAFLDPSVLGVFLYPPLYYMTRGDIFEKPFFRKLMESINMFPVFRMRDGYSSRDRNDEVFEFCRQKLIQRRVVAIYVEGEHHLEYRVRPIQKGIARIAFDTLERHELPDLQIIPAGCNYLYGDRPRDEVTLNIGEPIPLSAYREEYQHNQAAATNRLLADIETGLKKICLHIDDPSDDDLALQMLTLCRSETAASLIPIVEYHNRRFVAEKGVCDRINMLSQEEKAALRQKTDSYFKMIQDAGLHDDALMHPEWGSLPRLALFLSGFLPFLIGFITSYPVIWLAKYVTRKTVKKREFVSSVRMGVGHLGGMLYYFLLFLGSLLSWTPWWIALALALPALGWFTMFYRENWVRWYTARQARRHPERERLLEMRGLIK
jgi:1-acyl-sn-glycerol-3-phosphate acyltransferase